jgi:hypothetical protein
MNSAFCTILSKARFYQAIAFFGSMYEVMNDFNLHVLCVDDEAYNLLKKMNWRNITVTHLNNLQDEGLQGLKQKRKLSEFCWTLKPIFIEYLMKNNPTLERITYVDSDLFFFSNPSVIFENQAYASVLLSRGDVYVPSFSPQFTDFMQDLTGKYNSGFISFKNDAKGIECLKWWKKKCIDNCSADLKVGSFGDQKYLDFMPSLFQGVYDISTIGVNIGHWNYARYRFHVFNGKWYVDQSKLICYHFSGFRIISKNDIAQIYEPGRIDFPFVYQIYKEIIKHVISTIEGIEPKFNGFATQEDMTSGSIKLD